MIMIHEQNGALGRRGEPLAQFRPAVRPVNIPAPISPHQVVHASWVVGTLHAIASVPVGHLQPWAVRNALAAWAEDLGEHIQDTTWSVIAQDTLAEATPEMAEAMTVWLHGAWGTRDSLGEMLWRLAVPPRAITAADYLWLIGNEE